MTQDEEDAWSMISEMEKLIPALRQKPERKERLKPKDGRNLSLRNVRFDLYLPVVTNQMVIMTGVTMNRYGKSGVCAQRMRWNHQDPQG